MTDFATSSLFRTAKAAYDRQDHRTADDLCRQILAQTKNDRNALMLLAEVARVTERSAEQLQHVTRAVKLYPRDPDLRYQLGKVYAARGEYTRALVQYEKALKLDPDHVVSVIGRATVYEFQDKYPKARSLLEPLVRAAPTSPLLAMVYLRLLVHDGEHEAAIAAGRRVVDAGHPPGDPLRETWFQLARAYERHGDVEQAFAAARSGNAMQGDVFDVEGYRTLVDRTIATFSAETLATLPRADPTTLPVLIVGVPRCGSTLIERIIDAHPQTHGAGESRAMIPVVRDLALTIGSTEPYPECVRELGRDEAQTLSTQYLDELRGQASSAVRVTDKALGNYQHLGLVNVLLPGARVIHCRRNPVDTCLSCYLEPFARGQHPPACDLRNLGLHYREYERLMAHWRAVIDLPLLEVDYETLVTDQEATSRRIIEFCGLEWDDACLRFHETKRRDRTLSYDQVRRPVYRSSVGRAERFGAVLDPLREALGPR